MTHKTEIKLRVDLDNSVIFYWHPQLKNRFFKRAYRVLVKVTAKGILCLKIWEINEKCFKTNRNCNFATLIMDLAKDGETR